MLDEMKKNQNLIKILLTLLIIAVGSYVVGLVWSVLGQFKEVLSILLISWLLSFLLDPIVEIIKNISNFQRFGLL